MSFLNLPWQWDRIDTGAAHISVPSPHVMRWRRGPVTIYRIATWYTPEDPPSIAWWLYIADDFGFAITLPWRRKKHVA